MDTDTRLSKEDIRAAVNEVLGADRVRSVHSAFGSNSDGAEIVRVYVVYDAARAPTVKEMDRVIEVLWNGDATTPFPVIDFMEEADLERTAAE